MAGVDERLVEAAEALASLEELAGKTGLSLAERDEAILRLVYTFEAIWKASMALLETAEGISVASPNATIRAARRVGWLSDSDAEAALQLARERKSDGSYVPQGNRRANWRSAPGPCRFASMLARGSAQARCRRVITRAAVLASILGYGTTDLAAP
jgi:hypothetical protein